MRFSRQSVLVSGSGYGVGAKYGRRFIAKARLSTTPPWTARSPGSNVRRQLVSSPRTVLWGGTIFDGSGAEPRQADLAIRNGVIEAVGVIEVQAGDTTIDAHGRYLLPGFIDADSHADAVGIDDVFVGGQQVLAHGRLTGVLSGRGLHRSALVR